MGEAWVDWTGGRVVLDGGLGVQGTEYKAGYSVEKPRKRHEVGPFWRRRFVSLQVLGFSRKHSGFG